MQIHHALLGIIVAAVAALGADRPAAAPRQVLVELYSSQGCNSCPPAADVLRGLAAAGPNADRVVALNFHVDYFNKPWPDPFSDPAFSDRQLAYNQALRRDDLYFTPLMVVDGRTPFLGSDRARAAGSARKARAKPPGVDLALDLRGEGRRKSLTVRLASRSAEVVGRDLLVGVAVTQDHASTAVTAGENAGRTLDEFHVVRHLDHKYVKLDRSRPRTLTFPVELPEGGDPAGFRVAAFAQDRLGAAVHQAAAVRWAADPDPAAPAPRGASR